MCRERISREVREGKHRSLRELTSLTVQMSQYTWDHFFILCKALYQTQDHIRTAWHLHGLVKCQKKKRVDKSRGLKKQRTHASLASHTRN